MSADFIKQCLYTLNSGSGAVPPGGVVWLPYEPTDWEQFRGELRDSGWFLCDGSYVENVDIRYPEFAKHAKLMPMTRSTIITGLNPEFKFNMTIRSGRSTYPPYELNDLSWPQSFARYAFIGNAPGYDEIFGIPWEGSDLLYETPFGGSHPHISTDPVWQCLWMLCCNLGWAPDGSTSGVNQYSGSKYVVNNATVLSEFAAKGKMYFYTLADTSNWPLAEDCPTMLEALEKLAATSDEDKLTLFNQPEYRLSHWFTATEMTYTSEYDPEVITAVDSAITKVTNAKYDTIWNRTYERCGFGGLAKAGGLRFFNALRQAMVLSSKIESYVFKLPDLLHGRTLLGCPSIEELATVGQSTNGAVPNITGAFRGTGAQANYTAIFASGAFTSGGNLVSNGRDSDGTNYSANYSFDASRCSEVYQDVTQVIPAGVYALPLMKFY